METQTAFGTLKTIFEAVPATVGVSRITFYHRETNKHTDSEGENNTSRALAPGQNVVQTASFN